jgi:hypothetical protein
MQNPGSMRGEVMNRNCPVDGRGCQGLAVGAKGRTANLIEFLREESP